MAHEFGLPSDFLDPGQDKPKGTMVEGLAPLAVAGSAILSA